MRWMLSIAYRYSPGNTEWQYKTLVSRKPPERWLADRLEAVEIGETAKLDVSILYAREIDDEDASHLQQILREHEA